MSIWTQVVGNLVIDQHGLHDGDERLEAIFGPMSTWENYVEESTLPMGSEGNMLYFPNEMDNGNLQVLLVGCLRDQDDRDEVSTWIENYAQQEHFDEVGLTLLSGVLEFSIDDFYKETNYFNEINGKWVRETKTDINEKEYTGDKTPVAKIEVNGAIQLNSYALLAPSEIIIPDFIKTIKTHPDLKDLEWDVVEHGSLTSIQRFSLIVSGTIEGPIDEIGALARLIDLIEDLGRMSQRVRTGIFMVTPEGKAPVLATSIGDGWLYFRG